MITPGWVSGGPGGQTVHRRSIYHKCLLSANPYRLATDMRHVGLLIGSLVSEGSDTLYFSFSAILCSTCRVAVPDVSDSCLSLGIIEKNMQDHSIQLCILLSL